MIKSRSTIVLSIIAQFFSYCCIQAQSNVPRYEIGVGLGGFLYQGDLAEERIGSRKTIRVGANFFFSKLLSSSFALRTNLAIGGLRGDDSKYSEPEYRRQRNFKFKTPVVEISELVAWNPLQKNYSDKVLYPYFLGGIGVNFLNIKRDWSNFNGEYFGSTDVPARLAVDTAHDLPSVMIAIPLGAGIQYNISSRMAVNAEAVYRVLFTDYLDGFSVAANPKLKDKYMTLFVSAVYRIGKKNMLDCPIVRY